MSVAADLYFVDVTFANGKLEKAAYTSGIKDLLSSRDHSLSELS
jgi:hypothetical protein